MLGGANNSGTIFQMTPDGIVKILHEFVGAADGYPEAAPIQSLYGDFYGTTTGDDANPGTIYKIDTNGGFTSVHTFTGADGPNLTPHTWAESKEAYARGPASSGLPERGIPSARPNV